MAVAGKEWQQSVGCLIHAGSRELTTKHRRYSIKVNIGIRHCHWLCRWCWWHLLLLLLLLESLQSSLHCILDQSLDSIGVHDGLLSLESSSVSSSLSRVLVVRINGVVDERCDRSMRWIDRYKAKRFVDRITQAIALLLTRTAIESADAIDRSILDLSAID